MIRKIFYHLKAYLKRRSTWAVLLTLIFLILVYRGVSLPDINNTQIGVIARNSRYAASVLEGLKDKEGIYRFIEYDSEERLTEDILSGKLECGFIFDENFDKLVEADKLKKGIVYISSPYTTKGMVAKEVVYDAFLKDYSIRLLSKDAEKIFAEAGDEIMREIEERNEYYLKSSEIFTVSFK